VDRNNSNGYTRRVRRLNDFIEHYATRARVDPVHSFGAIGIRERVHGDGRPNRYGRR
jgi:hypothetical protein